MTSLAKKDFIDDPLDNVELAASIQNWTFDRSDNEVSIIANGKGDLLDSAGQLAGGLVGSNVAPLNLGINVATGFVPAGAVLKGAWWAANPVKTNMVKFAIGGGIGQAALEPFIHQERELEQREYDLSDSLINIAESNH